MITSGGQDGIKRLRRFVTGHWGQAILLTGVIAAGLWARLENLERWRSVGDRCFHRGMPLLTSSDGYFYLRLARDLNERTYDQVDELRGIPASPERPFPPPLMSVLAAFIARVTPFSLELIGAFLPIVLGTLLALPLYGLGRNFGGRLCGLAAAAMGLLSPYYIGRSGFGWFDTDCMNLTWLSLSALVARGFAAATSLRRSACATAYVLIAALFMWWWDFGRTVVIVSSTATLFLALALLYRPSRGREWFWIGAVLAGGTISILAWKGPGLAADIFDDIGDLSRHIAKADAGAFPSAASVIGEEVRPSFKQIALWSAGSRLAFLVAVLGFIWLCIKRGREATLLLPLCALGLLAFAFARRFVLFLVPVVALGVGFAAAEAWRLRKRAQALPYLAGVALAALLTDLVLVNRRLVQWPAEDSGLAAGLERIAEITPNDAVIWALWDHGYAINYFARRATVVDGSIHNGELLVYASLPFASDNPRLSAEFMHFYGARGKRGLRRLRNALGGPAQALAAIREALSVSPVAPENMPAGLQANADGTDTRTWNQFFAARSERSHFLLLDERLEATAPAWIHFGDWARTPPRPPRETFVASTFARLAAGEGGDSFVLVARGKGWALWQALTGR